MSPLPVPTASGLRLRQVCLVAPQLAPAVDALQATFGVPVCHRDPNVAAFGLENALFAWGHSFLEVVSPTRPGTAAGRFIERSGGLGGYMLIFDCTDPAEYRARAASLGVRVAFNIDLPGYRGVQLHPRDCRAAMLEFDHTQGGEALDGPYHPAGSHWQAARRPDLVQGLAQVEVRSHDAAGLAAHWARLMGVSHQPDGLGGHQLALAFGAIRVAPLAAHQAAGTPEHLACLRVQVGHPVRVLAAAAQAGCAVADGRFALAGVQFEPIQAGLVSND